MGRSQQFPTAAANHLDDAREIVALRTALSEAIMFIDGLTLTAQRISRTNEELQVRADLTGLMRQAADMLRASIAYDQPSTLLHSEALVADDMPEQQEKAIVVASPDLPDQQGAGMPGKQEDTPGASAVAERIEIWVDTLGLWWWRVVADDGEILVRDSGVSETSVAAAYQSRYPELPVYVIPRELDDSRNIDQYGPPRRIWNRGEA